MGKSRRLLHLVSLVGGIAALASPARAQSELQPSAFSAGAGAQTPHASPSAPVVPLGPTASIDLRALPVLDGPSLYRLLGRPDLAARYEQRRATKTALRVSGGILLGTGVLVGVVDLIVVALDNGLRDIGCLPADGTGPTSSTCQTSASASGIPWLVALGGLGMLIAPSFMETDPLTPAEKRALIDSATGAPPPRPLSLSFAPAPTTGGGQLVVGGHF